LPWRAGRNNPSRPDLNPKTVRRGEKSPEVSLRQPKEKEEENTI
jgi:hypothetical protein